MTHRIASVLLVLSGLIASMAPPAHAQPTVAPVGDGGSVGITVRNQSVHPLSIAVGPAEAEGVEDTLERYAEGGFLAQCIAGARDDAPALVVDVDRRRTPVEVPGIAFPDGAPVLWISNEPTGRARLQSVVEGALPGAPVLHLEPTAVPTTFAGLRFARLILVAASDYGRLEPAARQAVGDAVAAGVTLVVGTGEAGAAPDALRALLPVTLGEVRRPTGDLARHLGRASARRALTPEGVARSTMDADGRPILVEARRGLGLVRVIGVRFSELEDGALARAAFTPPAEPLAHVLQWLAQAPPAGETHPSPFGAHIWLLLAGLALALLLTRRRPRLALVLAVPWWIVALVVPPQWSQTRLDAARVLYVPAGDGALAVGTFDLTLTRGGARTLSSSSARVALEDASPGGACLIAGAHSAGWVVDGEAGAPRRITFFAMVEAPPEGADKLGDLPGWPTGALAGATLRRVQAAPLPLPLEPATLDAARVEPLPPSPADPAVLGGE